MSTSTPLYKNIVVTGGTGTLGTALQSITSDYPGRTFTFMGRPDCNLTDPAETLAYLRPLNPDAILHFAAMSGGVSYSMKYPATMLRTNVLMLISLLDAAQQLGIKKVVLCMSTGMYPTDAPLPLKEDSIHNGPPHPSNYSYAFAKRMMEIAVRAYREEYGLKVIGLVPNGIIGENANFEWESSVMPTALIRRFYENRDNDSKITIWGDGTPLREISYSKDLARAFMWGLDHYDDPQILNIGTTEEVTVKDTAFIIAELLGIDKNRIEFDISKPKGQLRKNSDNSRFVQLSHFKYTPYRDTLKHTIEYFVQNYNKPGKVRL